MVQKQYSGNEGSPGESSSNTLAPCLEPEASAGMLPLQAKLQATQKPVRHHTTLLIKDEFLWGADIPDILDFCKTQLSDDRKQQVEITAKEDFARVLPYIKEEHVYRSDNEMEHFCHYRLNAEAILELQRTADQRERNGEDASLLQATIRKAESYQSNNLRHRDYGSSWIFQKIETLKRFPKTSDTALTTSGDTVPLSLPPMETTTWTFLELMKEICDLNMDHVETTLACTTKLADKDLNRLRRWGEYTDPKVYDHMDKEREMYLLIKFGNDFLQNLKSRICYQFDERPGEVYDRLIQELEVFEREHKMRRNFMHPLLDCIEQANERKRYGYAGRSLIGEKRRRGPCAAKIKRRKRLLIKWNISPEELSKANENLKRELDEQLQKLSRAGVHFQIKPAERDKYMLYRIENVVHALLDGELGKEKRELALLDCGSVPKNDTTMIKDVQDIEMAERRASLEFNIGQLARKAAEVEKGMMYRQKVFHDTQLWELLKQLDACTHCTET